MTNPRTIARLESRIQERVAYCLQAELRDPRAGFITVTRVALNQDLSVARVHWSVMGDRAERSKSEHLLEHAKGFIRRQVAGVLAMRKVPDLRFEYDDSLEKAADLDRLIREARERDRQINPALAAADAEEAARAEAAGETSELEDEESADGELAEWDESDSTDADDDPDARG